MKKLILTPLIFFLLFYPLWAAPQQTEKLDNSLVTENLLDDDNRMGFIFPVGLEIIKDVQEMKKQIGLMNAEITGINARIAKMEVEINAQAGVINRISSNSGTQIFSGDVSIYAMCISTAFAVALVWGGFYYRKRMVENKVNILDNKNKGGK